MLRVAGLCRRFGDLVAVDRVSFDLPPGTMTGFVGGNGAGKTTTMRMIMGLLAPHAGTVHWDGRELTRLDRARFGYMPEERGLYPQQPIGDQLRYLGQLHGLGSAEAKRRSSELLDRFGLGARAKDKLQTLSLGNQQRVQIAAAVIADPIALVLDEPFSGLDPAAVDEMHALLAELTADGVPVLFSSHQLELVERLVDRIIILAAGRVVAQGGVQELREAGPRRHRLVTSTDLGWTRAEPGVQVVEQIRGRALLELPDPEAGRRLLAKALALGDVDEFAPITPTLAEIYREVTR